MYYSEPEQDKTNKNVLCAQERLSSALASTQSDQSSLCAPMIAKDLRLLHADREDWSDAQADLSLLGARHFVGFVMLWFIY